MNEEQKRNYIKSGGLRCPYCASRKLDQLRKQYYSSNVARDICCEDCGKQWTEIHGLVDVETND